MPMIEVEQGSDDWLTMRCGMVTGSRVADIVTRLKKGGYSAARQNYLMEVVVSRLTGLTPDHFVTPAMEWGIANESFARAAYEIEQDVDTSPAGFAMHQKIKWFGASPDRLVGSDGLLEIKCLTSANHLQVLLDGVVPVDYMPQMMAEMACADRQYCDFVSFDPRMPKHLQLFVRRFERDEKLIGVMEQEVELFLTEVEAMVKAIESTV
jgi:putative phage-type endonuclease